MCLTFEGNKAALSDSQVRQIGFQFTNNGWCLSFNDDSGMILDDAQDIYEYKLLLMRLTVAICNV